MSIKAFHIFFIVCAILISLIFAVWAIVQGNLSANQMYSGAGCIAVMIAVGLTYYGFNFVKKTKLTA